MIPVIKRNENYKGDQLQYTVLTHSITKIYNTNVALGMYRIDNPIPVVAAGTPQAMEW